MQFGRTLLTAMLVCAVQGVGFGAGAAGAADYPAKPIRLLVGFAAGGTSDILARALGSQLAEILGQQVIVDNRAAASGIIATELGARSPPDGYTVVFGSASAFSINPHVRTRLPYDPWRDFAPAGMFATGSYVLDVHPSVPARSVRELVAVIKRRPGQLNYGSPGYASNAHLATLLFMSLTGTRMQHVPYKGGAPALTDLMAGQIDVLFDPATTTLPHVNSGRLRALAVTTAKRSALFPDLPTMQEAGIAGYEYGNWFGLFLPAGTPQPIVARLNAAINQAVARPELRERLKGQGAEPLSGSIDAFVALLKAEYAKYGKIVRDAGIEPEPY